MILKIMPKKTESIKLFLNHKARPDLADLYGPHMEVQVMVRQGDGERIEGEYKGKMWSAWTDGIQTWKAIRIPYHAKTKPEYTDGEIKFDLAKHAESIGMTGWDWVACKSRYVAFDFDDIVGHSVNHTAGLTDAQLRDVRDSAIKIPWVTVRQSTSGNGLHLYVFLDGVDTANHTEHAALGRAILGKMSAIAGFDFGSKVDACGGNIWIWHDKFENAGGINGPGLKLIKKGEVLYDIPVNWRDHIKVISGGRRKVTPAFVESTEEVDEFMELCGQRPKIPLDVDHKKLMAWLEENRSSGRDSWFDADNHMLVCHTLDLEKAFKALGLRGIFSTKSSGSSAQNCFAFPMRKGVWSVRRHSQGVQETECWEQDASGWTRCYLNREPDLKTSAGVSGGVENDKGAFVFRDTKAAIKAAADLGAIVTVPDFMHGRQAQLRPHKDGRLIFEITQSDTDSDSNLPDWVKMKRGGMWQKVLTIKAPSKHESEVSNYEDMVRHLEVGSAKKDAGWVIKSDGHWCDERLEHVKHALIALGVQKNELSLVLGSSVFRRWTIVNEPFQPEYPGDRKWNRGAAQFAFAPALDLDSLKFDQWTAVLKHCGSGLDSAIKENVWCKANGVTCGGDYLKLWITWMFQHPLCQLPYLFLYGPEGSGKSIFHEAIELLMTRGVERADAALISQQGFNGELEGAIVCVVEETDLRAGKGSALNRIKDWVTAQSAPIHRKNGTPYTVPNSWHWIQTANDLGFCPMFPGDTRIVAMFVNSFADPTKKINKQELLQLLRKQAPDFLAHILHIDLPEPHDRLNIPIIVTEGKKQAQRANQSVLEEFLSETTKPIVGELIKLGTLHDKFIEWLPPSLVSEWTIIRFGREMVKLGYVKGRNMSQGAQFYIGNISFQDCKPTKPAWALEGDKLVST